MPLKSLGKPSVIFEEIRTKAINNEDVLPPQVTPVGGRLSNFVEGWKRNTNDPYVLSIVAKGYRLRFTSPPLLRQTPWEIRSPQDPQEILGISLMLQKNAIMEVPPNSPGFYSNVFLVRKASGGWRPVIDLKSFYSIGPHGDRLPAPSGDLGDTISGRLANSPSRAQSLTPTSGSANEYARPCRFCSKQKEIRAGPDSGYPVPRNSFTSGLRGSFPSRAQSLGDSCSRTPSILPPCTILYSSVPAHGVTQLGLRSHLIPLGRLYLRPLQRHFHSLGLTDRFTPPRRSDRLVLANLLRRWHVFLPQESLSARFRRSSRFLRTPPRRGGALTWGIPRFRVPGPIQTASSTSIVWSLRRYFMPYSIGLKCSRTRL